MTDMVILLLVFLTAIGAGLAFWFYNRKQINSLSESLDDKTAIINSFRDHLSTHNNSTTAEAEETQNFSPVVESKPEKKKKRYYTNNQKKDSKSQKPKQQPQQNSEKKNNPKPRKSKTQQ